MKKIVAYAVVAALLAASSASAQDCSGTVQSAQNAARTAYVTGMSGLAQNNFSTRPGSFATMACLDKFMQGNMDIMFKPPTLTSLLGTVMNFACQAAATQLASAAGGSSPNIGSLLGSLAGGLNIGANGGSLNLSQVLVSALGIAASSGALGVSGSNNMAGGLGGLYVRPGMQ